jgi:LPXTG-motif cell wall-anchored protein
MKNKMTRVFTILLAVMLCVTAFSVNALAYGGEETTDSSEEVTAAPAESSDPLTPDGNLSLVDDTESGDKEFITVQTKDGNTFYLIIDHASDEDNVYFLNLVDEEDLLALIDDDDFVSEYQASKDNTADNSSEAQTGSTVESASQTLAETETRQADTGSSGPIAAVLLAAVIIGAAVWFFKFRKPGKAAKNPTDPDDYADYDDGEDENEAESEPENELEAPDEETEREDE